ncbi:acyltransferase family protein [Ferruginibacter albus]|uniref:acyltransferase family protein n=1 Tax=Ferruginibacter albus TaxID=2875540 RepID=UPI001CC365A9|nr:acyltransferase [Ferruginibacter albus]UAY51327.1 acyltransferase [Ferruginibacter albus]
MTKPGRLTWIDYARGIAIILVLYRHVFEGIKASGISVEKYISLEHANIMFFSFRMPLFFIVSGIFVAGSLAKRGLADFAVTKVKTILYPYFLWGGLQITLQLVFSKYVNAQRSPVDYLYLLYLPRKVEQFWYLYALFNVSVIYAFVKAKFKLTAFQNIIIGAILFYVSSIIYVFHYGAALGFVLDILHYYLFFAIGDAISSFMNDRKNFHWFESWKTLLVLLVPFIISQVYFLHQSISYAMQDNDTRYESFEYKEPLVYILIAMIGCAFIACIAFMLQKSKTLNWLQFLGRHSLYIYVSHVIVFASLRVVLTKALHIYNVPVLLLSGIIAGGIVPILLYQLSKRLNMDWLFSLERSPSLRLAHKADK